MVDMQLNCYRSNFTDLESDLRMENVSCRYLQTFVSREIDDNQTRTGNNILVRNSHDT